MEGLNHGLQLELDFQAIEVVASRLADERTRSMSPQSAQNVSPKSSADEKSRKPALTKTRKGSGQDRRTVTSIEDVAHTHETTRTERETEVTPEEQDGSAE